MYVHLNTLFLFIRFLVSSSLNGSTASLSDSTIAAANSAASKSISILSTAAPSTSGISVTEVSLMSLGTSLFNAAPSSVFNAPAGTTTSGSSLFDVPIATTASGQSFGAGPFGKPGFRSSSTFGAPSGSGFNLNFGGSNGGGFLSGLGSTPSQSARGNPFAFNQPTVSSAGQSINHLLLYGG